MIAVTIVVILNVLGALSFPTGLSDTHCDQLLSDRFEKKTKKKKKNAFSADRNLQDFEKRSDVHEFADVRLRTVNQMTSTNDITKNQKRNERMAIQHAGQLAAESAKRNHTESNAKNTHNVHWFCNDRVSWPSVHVERHGAQYQHGVLGARRVAYGRKCEKCIFV